MTLLPDPKAPLRCEAGGGVAYLLRVPTVADRVALDRAFRAAGGRRWTLWQMVDGLAAGVRTLLPDEDDADRVRLLAMLAGHRDRLVTLADEGRALDPDDPDQAARAALADWSARWTAALTDPDVAALEETVARGVQAYRDRLADNETADAVRGLAAARLFVIGWEGLPGKPRRGLAGLDDASLERIPPAHLPTIAAFFDRASRLPEGAEKN